MSKIHIDKLAYGGSGFGRYEGKACFVPFTAPGDQVEITVVKNRSSYLEGVVEELIFPSKHRTTPPCPVFGLCGGCNWQHISYPEQIAQKENIFNDTLWRAARVESDKIKPILSAASPFGYRQRIQLKVDCSGGRFLLGFYRRGSHEVVDISDNCALAAAHLNSAISKIREIILTFKDADLITQVDLASSYDASVSAVFHYSGNLPEQLAEHLMQADKTSTELHSFSIKTEGRNSCRHVSGLDKLIYSIPASQGVNINLYYAPDSFSQVNFAQNRVMVQLLLDYCLTTNPDSILDLYSGNGNFSLPLAGSLNKILGFESVKKSVSLAQYNANVNGIQNANYVCNDSLEGIESLAKNADQFDLVIMDPPRSGAAEVSRNIHKIGASDLIYISCDPPTLGRDLSILQKSGFEVVSVQPVDMFPQTYHLESIVFLKSI